MFTPTILSLVAVASIAPSKCTPVPILPTGYHVV